MSSRRDALAWLDGLPSMPQGYDELLVPAVFAPWAEELVGRLDLPRGARVLDVATGTLALPARMLREGWRPVGLDAWDEMVAYTRVLVRGVPLLLGDFERLPFGDARFDAWTCQQGLQFADDAGRALREARRVLRPGGQAAFSVWCDLAASPGFAALHDAVALHVGEEAAPLVRFPFHLEDAATLRDALEAAGFSETRIERARRFVAFPSVEAFLRAYVSGSSLRDALPSLGPAARRALLDDLEKRLAPRVGPSGLTFAMEAHVGTARRP